MNNLALLLLRVIFSVSLITHVPAKITKLVDGRWDIHFPLSFGKLRQIRETDIRRILQ